MPCQLYPISRDRDKNDAWPGHLVDKVVRIHKDPGLPYFPDHWAPDRSHGPPASTDRLKSSAGPQRRAQAGELGLKCALVEAIVD